MMARLGFYFQSVSIVVVFLAALACASGDTNPTADAGQAATKAGSGGAGQAGQSGSTTPPTGTGGGTTVPEETVGTGGSQEPEPFCGDNLVNVEGEVCDGTDLAGASCGSLITDNIGELSCEADCMNYNTTMCYLDPEKEQPEAGSGDQAGYGG